MGSEGGEKTEEPTQKKIDDSRRKGQVWKSRDLTGVAVFLVGLADGTLPIAHVLGDDGSVADQAALEEERRLLYVGVTRAREHLQLSWALARNEGSRRTRRRSRFLGG